MSQRGGNYRGRGGSSGAPRGGGRGGRGGPPKGPPSGYHSTLNGPSLPDMSTLSLGTSQSTRVAVDDSPLDMANPEPVPKSNPIPGNRIDSQSLDKALSGPRIPGLQAEFPLRKAFYNSNTTVYTNHFAIKLDPNMPLYEYEIKGLPGKLGKKTAKILVREMINKLDFLRNHQDEFATDHCKTLVSWVNLPDTTLAPVSVSSEEGKELVILQLQRKGEVNTALLKQYAEGKAQPNKAVNDKILSVNEALNMVISKALSRDSFSLKANKFFVTGGHTRLGDSLCTMRGYFYSIKPGMGQILLNLNACTSAFYQPVLVSKFLLDNNTIRDQEERLSVLRGLRVHLTYDPKHSGVEARSRAATIEAYMKTIEETGLPCLRQTFNHKGRDGKPDEKPTVQQYFQKTYKKTLQYPQLPAINCGTKLKPLWYPAEVLQILPYQIYKRKVPDGLTKDMLDIACHPPKDTRALIEHEGLRKLGLSSSPGFARFSACPPIMIDSRMLQIPAAILPYPTPNYGNGIVNWSNPRDARDSKWNLMGRKFLQASAQTPFKVFMVVVPRDGGRSKLQSQPAVLQQVWKGFSTAAQHTYATGKFTYVGDTTCPPFAQPQIAQKVMAMAKDKGANLVLLLLEAKSTTAYSIFKDLADRTYDMHSLCAVYKEDRTGRPFGDQYWGNVMMKINLKAGGVNHTVTKVAEIMKDTLVLGADVTHPGPGSLQGTPSIAAIVGSVDQLGGKFLGSMRLQPRDTACEDIKDVEDMVLERIKAWVSVNKTLPKNILYYRDGVSSSQYSQVRENELPQIRKAFAAAAKQANMMIVPKFKLTAIVVAKRHHVRFLPPSNDAKDAMSKNGNCKPGTLVDTVVTSPYFQDFYLQSHDGLKGTAKPAHYFVLENEMGKTEKELQEFTHQLCYTYVRATMGVSYAPPAYYADRLCERGRCYLRPFLAPSQDFANRHKKMRFNVEQEIKAERETKFRGERTTDSMGMVVKSAEEKKQEETDRDRAEMVVKRNTFESAKATFYGSDIVRNPWKDAIGKTMFWM